MKFLLCAFILAATTAQADLTVSFRDGAPKDRFEITYSGACPLAQSTLIIDIGTAPAGLIFDTTAAGQGVEVFQPFELVAGAAHVIRTPRISDGDTQIALALASLDAGGNVAFTIDVDDTTSTRQITVSGSEMAGASLRLGAENAVFNASGQATIATPACPA